MRAFGQRPIARSTRSRRLKKIGGMARATRSLARSPRIIGGAGAMQEIEVADRRAGDDEAGRAGRDQPAPGAGERIGVAEGKGVDRLVDVESGGVADDALHVLERDLAAAGGIEAELLHFRAAGEPVGTDQVLQRRAGVGGDLQAGRLGLLVDDAIEVAAAVGIAGDRRGGLCGFAQAPYRRGLAEIGGR